MKTTLFLVLTSLLLVGCGTSQSYNKVSTYTPQSYAPSVYHFLIDWTKARYYYLPDDAQVMHVDCVNWALTDMQVGESCRWDYRGSAGIVKLVNVEGNHCLTLYNSVLHKGKTRNWQENACYNHASSKWRIY